MEPRREPRSDGQSSSPPERARALPSRRLPRVARLKAGPAPAADTQEPVLTPPWPAAPPSIVERPPTGHAVAAALGRLARRLGPAGFAGIAAAALILTVLWLTDVDTAGEGAASRTGPPASVRGLD